MKITTKRFLSKASETIRDARLAQAYEMSQANFRQTRRKTLAAVPDYEELRGELKAIRAETIASLVSLRLIPLCSYTIARIRSNVVFSISAVHHGFTSFLYRYSAGLEFHLLLKCPQF